MLHDVVVVAEAHTPAIHAVFHFDLEKRVAWARHAFGSVPVVMRLRLRPPELGKDRV